ncbi:MAG: hypothetical protein RLZZ324_171 [Candidatus Parcubacteria bacterium]|jgi:serine protease Do
MSEPIIRKTVTSPAFSSVVVTVVLSSIISSVFGFIGGTVASNGQLSDAVFSNVMPGIARMRGTAWQDARGDKDAVARPAPPPSDPVVDAVAKASPAVVSIVISKDMPVYEQQDVPVGGGDPFFQQFFGGMTVPQYTQKGTQKQDVGAGSGYVVSSDGYIVTNRHVVEDVKAEYTVTLTDKRKFVAKVLARDPVNDIAVLKIDAKDLPFLTFGDSDALKPGQKVIAIGFALGQFSNTVSTGIVSGLSRSIQAGGSQGGAENLYDVIQTDAAINPGNSGGPLLDMNAHVIGMNVAMVQGSQSIGFAIPAKDVSRAYQKVKNGGTITAAYLGVRYVMITKDLVDKNQLSVDHGALVSRGQGAGELAIAPGSPADIAGLAENDIILQVNGKDLTSDYPLTQVVSQAAPGDKITLTVLHKGVQKKVEVTLTTRK